MAAPQPGTQPGRAACFGSDLAVHLSDVQHKFGSQEQLPYVLSGADPFLRSALTTPGLFRTDVEPDDLSSLRARVEAAYASRRKLNLATLTRNWHAVSGLLKLYLKELPKPLLSHELFPYFIACADGSSNVMNKLGQLADLLGRLPPSAFRSAALVLSLLHDTSVLNPVMSATELAKIFAPLLLQPPSGTAGTDRMVHQAEAVLALMISNGKPDGALLTSAMSSQPPVDHVSRQMEASSMSYGEMPENIQWYYIDAQQNYVGPVDTAGLRQLRQHKYISSSTYVWAEQLSGWQKMGSLPQFIDASATGIQSPPMLALPPMSVGAPAAPASSAATLTRDEVMGARSTRHCSGSVSDAVATPPVLNGRTPATSAIGTGGVVAPPSLGLAVQRRRQASNPTSGEVTSSAVSVPSAPLNLANVAMRSMAAVPISVPAAALAGPPSPSSFVTLSVSGQNVPPPPSASLTVTAAPAAVVMPGPRWGSKGIPTPKMVSVLPDQTPWDSSIGMRLLMTGTGHDHVRAIIKDDGEVTDGQGNVLAYIEANGEVGDPHMNFVGKALEVAGQVVDANDAMVGEFDLGRGYIKDNQGSVIAEITKEGSLTNNSGQGVGCIDGFLFSNVTTLAAYFLLVDPSFVRTSSKGFGTH